MGSFGTARSGVRTACAREWQRYDAEPRFTRSSKLNYKQESGTTESQNLRYRAATLSKGE